MKIILLSDIHANLTAFNAVLDHAQKTYGDTSVIAHLGDIIDYGMRPNETLERLNGLSSRLIVNLAGNHEQAILEPEINHFNLLRSNQASEYTSSILKDKWFNYIATNMSPTEVVLEIDLSLIHI